MARMPIGRYISSSFCTGILCTGLWTNPLTAQNPPQFPAPTYARNAAIRLPIVMPEEVRSRMQEVKLYVRQEGEKKTDWQCLATVPASKSSLDCQLPGEGTFSLLFVLVDEQKRNYPNSLGGAIPQRVVVVDTTPPRGELTASKAANGDTFVEVRVLDSNPDPFGVTLNVRQADGSWQRLVPLAKDAPTVFRLRSIENLQSRFQLTLKDKAGNASTQELNCQTGEGKSPVEPAKNTQPDSISLQLPNLNAPNASMVNGIKPDIDSERRDGVIQANVQRTQKLPALEEPRLPVIQPRENQAIQPAGFDARPVQTPAWPKLLPTSAKMADGPLSSEIARDPSLRQVTFTPPGQPPAIKRDDLKQPAVDRKPQALPAFEIPDAPAPTREPGKLPPLDSKTAQPPDDFTLPPIPEQTKPVAATVPPAHDRLLQDQEPEAKRKPAMPGPAELPPLPEIGSLPPAPKVEPLRGPDIPKIQPEADDGVPRETVFSRRVALDFTAPANGNTKPDFWMTADRGKTWLPIVNEARVGEEGLHFNLPGKGIFGVRIRPHGGKEPPSESEKPDVWIQVKESR